MPAIFIGRYEGSPKQPHRGVPFCRSVVLSSTLLIFGLVLSFLCPTAAAAVSVLSACLQCLTVRTRHRNLCAVVALSATSVAGGPWSAFQAECDLPVPSISTQLESYALGGRDAASFIVEVVWPAMHLLG